MAIFLARRWTRQPNHLVKADRKKCEEFGITSGAFVLPGQGYFPFDFNSQMLTPYDPDVTGDPYKYLYDQQGYWQRIGISNIGNESINLKIYGGTPRSFTFFSRLRVIVGNNGAGVLSRTTTDNIILWRPSAQFDMRLGGVNYTQGGSWQLLTPYNIIVTGGPSFGRMYANNELVVSGGTPGTAGHGSEVRIGEDPFGGGSNGTFDYQYMLWGVRPTSEAQARVFNENPWQILSTDIRKSFFLPTTTPEPTGTQVKIYNGTAWETHPIKVYLGGSWTPAKLKKHNGSTWEQI